MRSAHLPRISVLLPVYNRAACLGAAVESVLGQTYGNFEPILADDGSGDLIQAWARRDDRIRHLPVSHNAIVREMLVTMPIWRGTLLFGIDVLRNHPFHEGIVHTDCEWPLRIARRHRPRNVRDVLMKVRRHADPLTLPRFDEHRREMARSHFRHFFSLYPRAPLTDYIALCRVADQVPFTDIDKLKRALIGARHWHGIHRKGILAALDIDVRPFDNSKTKMGLRGQLLAKRKRKNHLFVGNEVSYGTLKGKLGGIMTMALAGSPPKDPP